MEKDMIVCGKNNVIDAFESKTISKVYISREKRKEYMDLIKGLNVPYVVVDKYYLDKLTGNATHQGIAISISPIEYIEVDELISINEAKETPMIIMLDEVQDVNNLGAILRVIDGFDGDGIIFKKKRNVQITAQVAKVSTGAVNHVDICRVTNLVDTINKLKKCGYWVACLDMNGETKVQNFDFKTKLVVVLGGEDKGITDNIKKHCDFTISIDMYGTVSSLNVATAAAILSYQRSVQVYGERS